MTGRTPNFFKRRRLPGSSNLLFRPVHVTSSRDRPPCGRSRPPTRGHGGSWWEACSSRGLAACESSHLAPSATLHQRRLARQVAHPKPVRVRAARHLQPSIYRSLSLPHTAPHHRRLDRRVARPVHARGRLARRRQPSIIQVCASMCSHPMRTAHHLSQRPRPTGG